MNQHLELSLDVVGTMTGGGRQVFKGRMGSSVTQDVDTKDLANNETKLKKVGTRYFYRVWQICWNFRAGFLKFCDCLDKDLANNKIFAKHM